MSSNTSVQRSPAKLSNEVYQVVNKLNSKHSLGLTYDAALDGIQQTSDDRAVLRLLQFLYKNDRRLMKKTLQEFNREAVELRSGWVFKPRADRDLLPHRRQSLQSRENGQKQELTGSQVQALRSLLLSVLQGAKSEYFRSNSRSQSLPVRPLSQDVQATPTISFPQVASPTVSSIPGSSLDEDLRDFDLKAVGYTYAKGLHALQASQRKPKAPLDIEMADAEDSFSTPPQSPSEIHVDRGRNAMNTAHVTATRKRESPEANSYEGSRKRSMQHVDVQSPSPGSHHKNVPQHSESFETCMTSLPSTLRTTNANNSFMTNATSASFREREQPYHGKADPTPARLDSIAIKRETDLHQIILDKVEHPKLFDEQPQSFAELEGEPIYPQLGPRWNGPSKTSGLENRLCDHSPLSSKLNRVSSEFPFRVIYEVTRLSLHYTIPAEEIYRHLAACDQTRFNDYEYFWSKLFGYAAQYPGITAVAPEKSQATAWQQAEDKYDRVSLRADLQYTSSARGSFFDLRLLPLALESSYRLARQFGADRFLVFNFPSLEAKDLPKATPCSTEFAGEAIIGWLVEDTHYLLGREWRAFYVKPKAHKSKSSKESWSQWRIYLFAVKGDGFVQSWVFNNIHREISVEEMVKWFVPWEENLDAPALKLFSRLQLAVSPTIPTIVFLRSQIIYCDDTLSGNKGQRRLNPKRHDDKLAGLKVNCGGNVMSDGCSRISQQAAKRVAEMIGILDHIPSAFQARIGGAKGVWVVDTSGETLNGDDTWIEIADSQLKFEGPKNDWIHHDVKPDKRRLTFEVRVTSSSLKPAFLNSQLIPILIDRRVNRNIFSDRLADDLKEKSERLKIAMKDRLGLRVLSQEINPVSSSRIEEGSIPMAGGIQSVTAEQINALTESGFDPEDNKFLREACRKDIGDHCKRVEERARIEIGQSTYALMVPDFMGVLEEDEIHFGFSSKFTDTKSRFSDTMVNDCDVLIARLPAALPSDIHRVKAVFHRELAKLKDVIVFPTKGKFSLAEKLSGGDFDGDISWVCWDSEIVNDFENVDLKTAPPPEFYGITKDSTKIRDMAVDNDFFTAWLRKAFLFNMRGSLMGMCTTYHESYCYELFKHHKSGSMGAPLAVEIGQLLGHLVDTAKNGYTFTQQQWDNYRTRKRLLRFIPTPAFKQDRANPSDHILDQLKHVVAKMFRQSTLQDFEKRFKDTPERDTDLVQVIKSEEKAAQGDEDLHTVLSTLKERLEALRENWEIGNRDVRLNKMSWQAFADQLRSKFLEIQPWPETLAPKYPQSSLVRRWVDDFNDPSRVTLMSRSWAWIKASALYKYNRNNNLPYHAAGLELMEIKATATSGNPPSVTRDVHHFMKINTKMLESSHKREAERTLGTREVDIPELDAEEYMSQGYTEAFEALSWAE